MTLFPKPCVSPAPTRLPASAHLHTTAECKKQVEINPCRNNRTHWELHFVSFLWLLPEINQNPKENIPNPALKDRCIPYCYFSIFLLLVSRAGVLMAFCSGSVFNTPDDKYMPAAAEATDPVSECDRHVDGCCRWEDTQPGTL